MIHSLRVVILSGLCATAFTQVYAEKADGVSMEPVPEQAFSSTQKQSKPLPLDDGMASTERRADPPPPSPDAGSGSELDLGNSIDLSTPSAPFYKRWLESLFDLIAPGEPYRRDKAVLIVGTSVGYDDNVLYSALDRISSATYGINGAIDYKIGTRRLKLESKFNASINYYENRPGGSNDQNYGLDLLLTYQLMPRLGVSFETYTAYLSQPSPQLIGGTFQYSGSYFYTNTTLDLNYQLRPRLGLSLGYAVNGFKYDDEVINNQSGYFQQNVSVSANWLYSPRTTFILQYRYNPVQYYGTGLGSTGQFLLVGIEQALSPRFNYTLFFGAEHRQLENPDPNSPSSYLGPFVEGALHYNFTPSSGLIGNLRLGTEPAGVTGVTIRQSFRASLGGSHLVGSRLSIEPYVGFERDIYDQSNFIDYTQDIYSASLVLRYRFALYLSAVLRDDYLVLKSTLPDSSYSRNYVSIGLEATF